MVASYKDITLGQFLQMQELKDLNASDAVKELMFISILSGKSTDELRKMSNADYAEMQSKIKFLADTTPDDVQPASEVTINGREYTITDEAAKFTAGQYIDFISHTQNGDGLIDLLSCLIIPKGHEYAEGYDMEKVKADIMDLPLPVANYISFFLESLADLIRNANGTGGEEADKETAEEDEDADEAFEGLIKITAAEWWRIFEAIRARFGYTPQEAQRLNAFEFIQMIQYCSLRNREEADEYKRLTQK